VFTGPASHLGFEFPQYTFCILCGLKGLAFGFAFKFWQIPTPAILAIFFSPFCCVLQLCGCQRFELSEAGKEIQEGQIFCPP
jgi:hypothetical protein